MLVNSVVLNFDIPCKHILVSVPDSLTWARFEGDKVPEHAVIGGRDEDGGVLYVGRCGHKGTLTFGHVFVDQMYGWVSTNGTGYKHDV
jgi:hypothetical protein